MEVLHRNEWCEFVVDCVVLHCLKLIGVAARHPNVANVTSLNNVVERLHCLFNRSIRVETVALKYVYVVQLQALQGVLN